MGILKSKIVAYGAGFPVTLALSAGLALPMAVADAAISAHPAAAAPVAPPPAPEELTDALLTVDDLPDGYSVIDYDPSESLAGIVDPSQAGGDPCAKPGEPEPAADVTVPDLAGAGFIKGVEGPVLMETLYGAGRRYARALVRDTAEVLKRCPDVETETVRIEQEPLRRFPALGDASVAMEMVVTLKRADHEISVDGKLVAIASGDVYLTVALIGMPAPSTSELKKLAKAAVRKLERS